MSTVTAISRCASGFIPIGTGVTSTRRPMTAGNLRSHRWCGSLVSERSSDAMRGCLVHAARADLQRQVRLCFCTSELAVR